MINIYTVSDKRPDFIELQIRGLNKYILDIEYQFIVCNNGSTPALREEIHSVCRKHQIKTLDVEGSYVNGAIATEVPLKYCLKNYIANDNKEDITVIIDSDIFLFAPLSFEKLLGDAAIAGVYQQREVRFKRFFIRNHFYLWNALLIISNKKIALDSLDISLIPNVTDVGGRTNDYLRNYKPKVKWLDHTADIENKEMEIFHERLLDEYSTSYGMQIIENALIHYYRGSNWDAANNKYHELKTGFLLKFLELADNEYPLKKDLVATYLSNASHTRKHFNGSRDNSKPGFKITDSNYRITWI
jgi:hypothetical protein